MAIETFIGRMALGIRVGLYGIVTKVHYFMIANEFPRSILLFLTKLHLDFDLFQMGVFRLNKTS